MTAEQKGALLTALEAIEVHGSANLDRLLGVIQYIRKLPEETREEQADV